MSLENKTTVNVLFTERQYIMYDLPAREIKQDTIETLDDLLFKIDYDSIDVKGYEFFFHN